MHSVPLVQAATISVDTKPMPLRSRIATFGVSLPLAILSLACVKRTEVYQIRSPEPGWVEVHLGEASCPPLPVRDGKEIFVIPESGRLCTSSEIQTGWGRQEFFLLQQGVLCRVADSASDKDCRIWNVTYSVLETEGKREKTKTLRFFVGTKDQFEQSIRSEP